MPTNPPFGQADLTNCERELIHLAASVQPHGVLLTLDEAERVVLQASANAGDWLGRSAEQLLGQPIKALGGNLHERIATLAATLAEGVTVTFLCHTQRAGYACALEGTLHRHPKGGLIVELEPIDHPNSRVETVGYDQAGLLERLADGVRQISAASNIGVLADAAVKTVRDLTGYDRVMVYKFDPDGHGKIIAEARDPRLESLLGHHYPSSDIPQRARELYLRNRVRVLVDVHYVPSPLVPRMLPLTGLDLDMSLCYLRSMSPLHLQYLKNMGVTATLVVSLVREGRLWGLIAAHHYSPRNLRYSVRAAADLLSEVISTRIAAIESYAHAQVAILVRRLEQRLIEATSTEGDWRLALFRNPHTLLQPLEATGAALFHEDEILTSGEVPSTPELRALLSWVDAQRVEPPFNCSAVGRANPALDSLTPTASGILAVKLSTSRPDYLMWFRKEQLQTVTWAGDPNKQMVGNDPLELSPRRSFAAWSEIVRGTALPWSAAECALARAIGSALVDIILQVHGVRLLIAEHQLARTRTTVQSSDEPVVIAQASGRLLFANEAFERLLGVPARSLQSLAELAELFTEPQAVHKTFASLCDAAQPWRGELALRRAQGSTPVNLRAEVVPSRDGSVLGFILILIDLSDSKRAQAARQHLEQSLSTAARVGIDWNADLRPTRETDEVINAILTNVSLAAMDIAEASGAAAVAPMLEELEVSAQRAALLYGQLRAFTQVDS